MTRTVICPIAIPAAVHEETERSAGRDFLPQLRQPLPARAAGTHAPTTVLCIDDDPLVLHFYREYLDGMATGPHGHGGRSWDRVVRASTPT